MLEASTLQSYLPLAARILRGEAVQVYDDTKRAKIKFAGLDDDYDDEYDDDVQAEPKPNSVAIYPISGVITKNDQMCGPMGTISLMAQMRRWEDDDRVIGHLLQIDSGGGEATNIETVARFIRQDLKKPVIAWVNGMAASAAYYIAAAADAIYASQTTDIFGSIGVVMSFADVRPALEKQGVVFHEIYADQSDLKNLDFREAIEGNYERLRATVLNPYAEQFIGTVKEFRPGITREETFRGEILSSNPAIEHGLIDGYKTQEQAIEQVFTLKKNNDMSSTMKRMSAIIGYELQSSDGGVYLNADELAKLQNHLAPTADEVQEIEAINARLDLIAATIDGLSAEVTAFKGQTSSLETNLAAISQRVDAFGQAPAAPPATGFVAADPAMPGTTGAKDSLTAFEEAAAYAAKNGMGLAFTK
jgi:protease-4